MDRRRRVLIVEDSPTQAQRLRTFLEAEDLEVMHVNSAEDALEHLHSDGADLVLLDFQLPGMNGDLFCREIRMNINTRAIPVLMLTGQEGDAAQLRSLDSGADDYLPKTADPDVLRVRIRALLRKGQSARPIVDVEKRFSRARVLAIDDSPTYLYVLSKELSSENYIVETADSPEDGLEKLRGATFDCVLVDYEMPGLNGAEVCRRIRHMYGENDQQLVLIMLSSHEDKERLGFGFDAGADDYIAKSSDLAITKARIRALLRRKFLVEENRQILEELNEKELQTLRAKAAEDAAEMRATMADQLAQANRELELANRKLDDANQELEQFAAAAAHDLREPLRMVALYSQLLQQEYAGGLDETANEYLSLCVAGTRKMDGLIRDLLLYAMATKDDDRSENLSDLNDVLERAIDNLRGVIEETGAVILHDPLPMLYVREIRIQQVFQNLIGNAIKYRRPEEPPRIRVSGEQRDGEWQFVVEDNGRGIEPAYQQAIFEPFRQVRKEESSGTGLGLAICQRIISRYGGRIWVESVPGQGSRFHFALPA